MLDLFSHSSNVEPILLSANITIIDVHCHAISGIFTMSEAGMEPNTTTAAAKIEMTFFGVDDVDDDVLS